MVEYNRFYTIEANPLISNGQIVTFTNTDQKVKSGYIDFTKPFRLSVTYNMSNSVNKYSTLLEIKPYNTSSLLSVALSSGLVFFTIYGSSATSSYSYDITKTYILTIEWDGAIYKMSFNSTDGVHTFSNTLASTRPITMANVDIGTVNANVSVDLKSFVVRHLDDDYEYRLVEEVKPITDPGTVKGKLEYLENTKELIIKSLRSKGINIDDNTTFRVLSKYIIDGFSNLDKWICIIDSCQLSNLYNNYVYIGSSTSGQSTKITNGFYIYDTMFDSSKKMNIYGNNGSINYWQSVYSEKYRNSIFSLYQNGTNTSFYTVANRENNLVHPTLGYFVTDETGRIIKNVPVYDEAYAYKPDKYVENFLTYNPSDKSITLKSGEYQACYTKPITEAIINVDTDKVLSFDESMAQYGYLTWRDADYSYNLQVSPPSNHISMSLLDSNNPDIPNYIISRKMKTTGSTSIRLYNSSSTSYYQNFTTGFVDISPNVLSTGTVQFRSGSSTSFGFANVGDQYIIRTEVGDGFRNNIDPNYIYSGSYLSSPTSLTHTRQLTLLDGSTRLIDDGSNRNITVNELKSIRYIDDIYTVNSTTSSSVNRNAYFNDLVTGNYNGAFSYGLSIDTTYSNLSISAREKNSKVNLYINIGSGLQMEGFSNKPKYPIL